MGFDLNIFVDRVDDELLCSICTDVLEDPVQLIPCQHLYCQLCLNTWFEVKTSCPDDGLKVSKSSVTSVPRSIKNILSKLNVRCERCHTEMSTTKYRSHNCFQEILSQMGGYIEEFNTIIMSLENKNFKNV